MPKVNGYLSEFTLQAGDAVQAGQAIARISRPDLEAQVLRDEAALARATAQLLDLEAGSRVQERQEIAANLAAARSVHQKALLDYDRYEKLYAKGAVSLQQLDAARSALDVAYNSMQALEQRLSLSNEGSRPQAIEAQRLEVERSKAVLAASRVLVQETLVTSPISGLVLSKNFENGEYINPGSALATIGDMNDCWVKIYVPSSHLGLIKAGQQAEVKVDSFPDKVFAGIIKEISQTAEFTPRQSITQRERANLVFAVKVKVDNQAGSLKPGMPADVVIK
jgi:HlyD family secretion protein